MRMIDPRLPNFFILGAAKAGTTTLYGHLKGHPEVFLSQVKEPHFFDNDAEYRRGYQYYADTYFTQSESYSLRGEATPAYLRLPRKVAPRIRNCCGDKVKFLVLLRDPVQRALSHYRHRVKFARESASFEKAIRLERERLGVNPGEWVGYYSDGLYGAQLVDWFDEFEQEQFCLVLTEELRKDPVATLKRVTDFLGVRPLPEVQRLRSNVGAAPRAPNILKVLFKWSGSRAWLKRSVNRSRYRRLANMVLGLFTKPFGDVPTIPEHFQTELRSRYRRDIELLEKLTDLDLSHWRT